MLWDWDGTLERIHHALYVATREREGREASPNAKAPRRFKRGLHAYLMPSTGVSSLPTLCKRSPQRTVAPAKLDRLKSRRAFSFRA